MGKTDTGKKDGRNKPNKNSLLKIDAEQVEKLALKFWAKSEIAAFLNCHVDTITNRFQDVYLKGREQGKAKLRDLQLQAANKGNVTMLIWLGKQYLEQSDKAETSDTMTKEYTNALIELAKQQIKEKL